MKKITIIISFIGCCIVFVSFNKQPGTNNEVPYPEGYRTWTHIKSMIVTKEHPGYDRMGGYHHIYANDKAMEGYKTGRFPDGAIIVADFMEINEKNGAIHEGKRKFIDVMIKDNVLYKSTGGWGFEEFDKDSKEKRLVTQVKATTECFNCHASKTDNDYVFSTYRE